MQMTKAPLAVVIPAAGIGKRMKASCPKQYLEIGGITILEHTVSKFINHPQIEKIVLVISEGDEYFYESTLKDNEKISLVDGGAERVDSVLAGLESIDDKVYPWVLVHDAARPCLTRDDLDKLITECISHDQGGILAIPVRDTMKRSNGHMVSQTVEREHLWHALTPQMFPTTQLINSINDAISVGYTVTDEASAIEYDGGKCLLIEGSSENIKITRPSDLELAKFFLSKQPSIEEYTCV